MRIEGEALERAKERQNRYKKVPGLRLWFKGSRCPRHYKTSSAILDVGGLPVGEKWGWSNSKLGGMGRFGGGWKWKLGIEMGGTSLIFDWIWGGVRFTWGEDPAVRDARSRKEMKELSARLKKDREEREARLTKAGADEFPF